MTAPGGGRRGRWWEWRRGSATAGEAGPDEAALATWCQGLPERPRIYGEVSETTLEELRRGSPEELEGLLATSDLLLQHRFRLLGSGPFVPHDPDRPARADGYHPIDWRLDPVSGLRFPGGFAHRDWDLARLRPGNAEVKLPWELGRCQHWPVLGQAWRLTRHVPYALEVVRQLDDFEEANPVGTGVQWACTMDVAIRAANWVLVLELLRDCPAIPPAFWPRAVGALWKHGRFIRANVENTYEVTSNHFLSDVVGLFALSRFLHGLPEASDWSAFCREALETEMTRQVLEDGADYESSVPYHRLVLELFLAAARMADTEGRPLSANYRARLRSMVEFLLAVLRPDGLMPQVGDADDGRFHVFTGYGRDTPQDPRHLLAPAALVLGEPSWLRYAGRSGGWEAAWWGFEVSGLVIGDDPPPPTARLLPEAGLAAVRRDRHFLLVTNGRVGTGGFGNHKHNDLLSFEYHWDGRPVFVDPGSYVYTSDPAARNLFRSVSSHNTVRIDGLEPNEMREEWLFRLFETANPEHLAFRHSGDGTEYVGRHHGYARLHPPVVHTRGLRLLPSGVLLVLDLLEGGGPHRVRWHFHGAPGISMAHQPEGLRLHLPKEELALVSIPSLELEPRPAWYSPSYGVRLPCQALEAEQALAGAGRSSWLFVVAPPTWLAEAGRGEELATWRGELEQACLRTDPYSV